MFIEGIITNPTIGKSTKDEFLRMINYYEEDYQFLNQNNPNIIYIFS